MPSNEKQGLGQIEEPPECLGGSRLRFAVVRRLQVSGFGSGACEPEARRSSFFFLMKKSHSSFAS